MMRQLEKEGYRWIFGQRPTEIDLYEEIPNKIYYLTLEGKMLNFKHKDGPSKTKCKTGSESITLDDDLTLIKALLSKEEFKGYIKGCLINTIEKGEERKQELMNILEDLKND